MHKGFTQLHRREFVTDTTSMKIEASRLVLQIHHGVLNEVGIYLERAPIVRQQTASVALMRSMGPQHHRPTLERSALFMHTVVQKQFIFH